jgi:hypothetical protein
MATTNDRGEYWIQGLEKGRYYVSLRCSAELEAPHPLMSARDPRRPYMVYTPQFYPGVPDTNGATRLRVTPGLETQGIDFQARRTTGVTVRGRVDVTDPSALAGGNVNVVLLPPSLDPSEGTAFGGSMDSRTGEFQIRAVVPGSYVLVATTFGEGPVYLAQVPLQIGATQPDPIRVMLAPVPEIGGRVEVEGDSPVPLESLHVTLEPLGSALFVRHSQAQVGKDGAFTLANMTPGRWRLQVLGASYVKSLMIGPKDVSPYGFDLAPGMAGPIRIVASNKTGSVLATVSATSDGSGPVSLLLAPADPDRLESGLARANSVDRGGHTTIPGIIPGRYRLFAFDTAEVWSLQQRPEVLKALESHAQAIEVGEGDTAQATVDPVEASNLEEALQAAQ